jgi:hypothetical protein
MYYVLSEEVNSTYFCFSHFFLTKSGAKVKALPRPGEILPPAPLTHPNSQTPLANFSLKKNSMAELGHGFVGHFAWC